jgi:starvation-inducible DNA-binding protein
MTHNFHWNVTGPTFNTLHLMFMGQYTELWNAVDPVAERIRALGHPDPGSYAQFGRLSSIKDVPESPPAALDMVRILVDGHEAVARTARGIFPLAAKAGDEPTADLLTQRLGVHEQTAWMLRSLLELRRERQAAAQSSSSMCFGQLLFKSFESARSASTLPPVWQRAQ